MMRKLTPLEHELQTTDTLDLPARQAAIIAVNAMMDGATRSGALLSAARDATMQAAGGGAAAAPLQANAAALAQQAYTERTNAEVAKYTAAYALLAEEHGQASATAAQAAENATSAQAQGPFIQEAKYHGAVRNLMMQASEATKKALQSVPPLPPHITGQSRLGPEANIAQGGGDELLAQPTYGWRPKNYSNLMGPFFPANYKLASAALSGVHGVSLGDDVSTDAAPPPTPPPSVTVDAGAPPPTPLPSGATTVATGSTWFSSLEKAIGFGVAQAGSAALTAGQQQTATNPSGGNALQTGGTVLNVLANMMGASTNQYPYYNFNQTPSLAPLLVVGGVLAVGGFLIWKFT